MIIAYLRVSTGKQTLENQRNEIERFAAGKNMLVNQWVTEIVSGRKQGDERKLGHMLRRMQAGDILIVTELSRLSRTLTDIMTIMGDLLRRDITLYSTKDNYVFDNTINSKVLCFAFGLVAELERNLISVRTREALALRRQQGIKFGRPKGSYTKLQTLIDNRQEILKAMSRGVCINVLCRKYRVSRDTFNRFRHEAGDKSEQEIISLQR